MAKTITDDITKEIKKSLDEKEVVIGTESALKNLKLGNLAKIYVSSNCPADVKDELNHLASIAGTEIVSLDLNDEELGVICKKPFSISVLSVIKNG